MNMGRPTLASQLAALREEDQGSGRARRHEPSSRASRYGSREGARGSRGSSGGGVGGASSSSFAGDGGIGRRTPRRTTNGGKLARLSSRTTKSPGEVETLQDSALKLMNGGGSGRRHGAGQQRQRSIPASSGRHVSGGAAARAGLTPLGDAGRRLAAEAITDSGKIASEGKTKAQRTPAHDSGSSYTSSGTSDSDADYSTSETDSASDSSTHGARKRQDRSSDRLFRARDSAQRTREQDSGQGARHGGSGRVVSASTSSSSRLGGASARQRRAVSSSAATGIATGTASDGAPLGSSVAEGSSYGEAAGETKAVVVSGTDERLAKLLGGNSRLSQMVGRAANRFKGKEVPPLEKSPISDKLQKVSTTTPMDMASLVRSAATKTAVERVKSLVERYQVLKLRNFHDGEPSDRASAVLREAAGPLTEAAEQFARLNISYNPSYAEKIFRGLLPKVGGAVKAATVAMADRATSNLDEAHRNINVLKERNEAAGSPQDAATESLAAAIAVVDAADAAFEHLEANAATMKGTAEFGVTLAFLDAVGSARDRVNAAGVNMTSRFEQIIKEADRKLADACAALDRNRARHEWINEFGAQAASNSAPIVAQQDANKASAAAAIDRCSAAVSKVEQAKRAMASGGMQPHLADAYVRVARTLRSSVAEMISAVAQRTEEAVSVARSYTEQAASTCEALGKLNDAAGSPADPASSAYEKLVVAVADAREALVDLEETLAEKDTKWGDDTTEEAVSDFIDQMEPLHKTSDRAFDAMHDRAWQSLDKLEKASRVASAKRKRVVARNRVRSHKKVTAMLSTAESRLRQALTCYDEAEAAEERRDEEPQAVQDSSDLAHIQHLLRLADTMDRHVAAATSEMDSARQTMASIESKALDAAREQIAQQRLLFSKLEERQRAAGSPSDEATELMRDAEDTFEEAGEALSSAVDALDDVEAVWDAVDAAAEVVDAVATAQTAVEAREDALVEAAARELDDAEREIKGFQQRRKALKQKRKDSEETRAADLRAHADGEVALAGATNLVERAREAYAVVTKNDDSGSARESGRATPTDVAKFLAAMQPVRPALTKVALMAKAAVGASCDLLSFTREKLKSLSKRQRTVHWFFDAASSAFKAADEAVHKASGLEEQLVVQVRLGEEGEPDDGGAEESKGREDSTAQTAAQSAGGDVTRLEDELIEAVAEAARLVDFSESAFDERDAKLVGEARKEFGSCNANLQDAERRNRQAGNRRLPALRKAIDLRLKLKGEAGAQDLGVGFADNVREYKAAVDAAVEAVRLRQEEVVTQAEAEMHKYASRVGNLKEKVKAGEAGEPTPTALQELAAAEEAVVAMQDCFASGAVDDTSGKVAFKFLELVKQSKQTISKAIESHEERVVVAEAARASADSQLPAAAAKLEELRAANRASGAPDDEATSAIESAWLELNTAETLRKVILRSPNMAGMAEQFVAAVKAAVSAVDSAGTAMAARNQERAVEMRKELQEKLARLDELVVGLRGRVDVARARLDAFEDADRSNPSGTIEVDDAASSVLDSASVVSGARDERPEVEQDRARASLDRVGDALERAAAIRASVEAGRAGNGDVDRALVADFEACISTSEKLLHASDLVVTSCQKGVIRRLRRVVAAARSAIDALSARERASGSLRGKTRSGADDSSEHDSGEKAADYATERLRAAAHCVVGAESILDDAAGDGTRVLAVADVGECSGAVSAASDAVRIARQAMHGRMLSMVRTAQLRSGLAAARAALDESQAREAAIRANYDAVDLSTLSADDIGAERRSEAIAALRRAQDGAREAINEAVSARTGHYVDDPGLSSTAVDEVNEATVAQSPPEKNAHRAEGMGADASSRNARFIQAVSKAVAAVDAAAQALEVAYDSGMPRRLFGPASPVAVASRSRGAAQDKTPDVVGDKLCAASVLSAAAVAEPTRALDSLHKEWHSLRETAVGRRHAAYSLAVAGSALTAARALEHLSFSSNSAQVCNLFVHAVDGAKDAVAKASVASSASVEASDMDVTAVSEGDAEWGDLGTDFSRRYATSQSRLRSVEEELVSVRTQCEVNPVLTIDALNNALSGCNSILESARLIAKAVSGESEGRAALRSAVASHMVVQFEGAVLTAHTAVDRLRKLVRSVLARAVGVQNAFRRQRDVAVSTLDKAEETLADVKFEWEVSRSSKHAVSEILDTAKASLTRAEAAVAEANEAVATFDDAQSQGASNSESVVLVFTLVAQIAAAKSACDHSRACVADVRKLKRARRPDEVLQRRRAKLGTAEEALETALDALAAHERAMATVQSFRGSRDPNKAEAEALVRASTEALRQRVRVASRLLDEASADDAADDTMCSALEAISGSELVASAASALADGLGVDVGAVVTPMSPQEAHAVSHLERTKERLALEQRRIEARKAKDDDTNTVSVSLHDAATRANKAIDDATAARSAAKRATASGGAPAKAALNNLTMLVAQAVVQVDAVKLLLDEEQETLKAKNARRSMKQSMAEVLLRGAKRDDRPHWKTEPAHASGSKSLASALVDPSIGRYYASPEHDRSIEAIVALPIWRSRRARQRETSKAAKARMQKQFVSLFTRLKHAGRHHKRIIDTLRQGNMTSMPPFLGVPLREKLMQATNALNDVNLALPTAVERALRPPTKAQLDSFEKRVRESGFLVFAFEAAADRTRRELERLAQQRRQREQQVAKHSEAHRRHLIQVAERLEADKQRGVIQHGGPPQGASAAAGGAGGPVASRAGGSHWDVARGRGMRAAASMYHFSGGAGGRARSPVDYERAKDQVAMFLNQRDRPAVPVRPKNRSTGPQVPNILHSAAMAHARAAQAAADGGQAPQIPSGHGLRTVQSMRVDRIAGSSGRDGKGRDKDTPSSRHGARGGRTVNGLARGGSFASIDSRTGAPASDAGSVHRFTSDRDLASDIPADFAISSVSHAESSRRRTRRMSRSERRERHRRGSGAAPASTFDAQFEYDRSSVSSAGSISSDEYARLSRRSSRHTSRRSSRDVRRGGRYESDDVRRDRDREDRSHQRSTRGSRRVRDRGRESEKDRSRRRR